MSKKHSGSDEYLAPKGRAGQHHSHDEFRPRASTMPADVLRRLKEGRRKSREEHGPNAGRRQAWAASTKQTTPPSSDSDHDHVDNRVTQGYYRARAQTMPSRSTARTRPGSRDGPVHPQVAMLSRSKMERSGSLDGLTVRKSLKNNNHGDHSSRVHWASDEKLVDSAEDFINHCLSVYSDESLAVQPRDPLPKGSDEFEKVRHQIENEKTDITTDSKSNKVNNNGKKKMRRRSKTGTPPASPGLNRHVHWKTGGSRK